MHRLPHLETRTSLTTDPQDLVIGPGHVQDDWGQVGSTLGSTGLAGRG